jgi:uncharacterized protein
MIEKRAKAVKKHLLFVHGGGEFTPRADLPSKLPEGMPVFFYHSRDDEVVPFAHLALYKERLPWATVREFDDRGHQFGDNLSEVARDIEKL